MQAIGDKKIKDPVYGYISIPSQYIKGIIDTSIFQRLRRVIQTSYSPLYASAMHNRFAHSLGVFHLGSIVAERLKEVMIQQNYLSEKCVERYAATYQIACLLHDIGHAPFSHTGEIYYKNDNFQVTELHKRLCSLVQSRTFENDLPGESEGAAPHEIMSAIVGIKEFGNMIGDDENKELFARCITGYKYKDSKINENRENSIKNCFISMLNSKVIDVDRLDYLIRDAYTSGFATVNIDYVRLLKALTVVKYKRDEKREEDGEYYEIAYQKDAVSLIENVVYAHDAERKWIQNHPVVVYEAYILKCILENLNGKLNTAKHRLFSEQSLSREGNKLKGGRKVSLLCDDDIIYLAKNVFPNEFSEEYFERNKRRHPVWKSEAEYKAYINGISRDGELGDTFMECMKAFNASKIAEHPVPIVINDDLMKEFERELEKGKEDENFGHDQMEAVKRKLNVCRYLEKCVEENDIPFDFIIIPTTMFSSNFSKKHLEETLITFEKKHDSKERKVKKLKEVCNLLKSDSIDKDFYYLFYRRKEKDCEEDEEKSAENVKTYIGKAKGSAQTGTGKIEDIEKFCSGLFYAANLLKK